MLIKGTKNNFLANFTSDTRQPLPSSIANISTSIQGKRLGFFCKSKKNKTALIHQ